MVGDRKDSALYVKTKRVACQRTGIRSENFLLPENVDERVVLEHVHALNADPTVDGILVQVRTHLSSGATIFLTTRHNRRTD
ncbi:hypothetical protein PINS_up003622 [Pythium insidiosum]|nr:hypothetical protein PINS_up003622 [Pythium insidiosum]